MSWIIQLLFVILAAFLVWWLYRGIRANPQAFSKENLGKSAYTLGVLALILIAFIALCVMMLKGA